ATPPAAVISPTTRFTPAPSTSTTATCAPSRAKRSAPARPMPEAAAVTIPIFPAIRIGSPPPENGHDPTIETAMKSLESRLSGKHVHVGHHRDHRGSAGDLDRPVRHRPPPDVRERLSVSRRHAARARLVLGTDLGRGDCAISDLAT